MVKKLFGCLTDADQRKFHYFRWKALEILNDTEKALKDTINKFLDMGFIQMSPENSASRFNDILEIEYNIKRMQDHFEPVQVLADYLDVRDELESLFQFSVMLLRKVQNEIMYTN